MAIFHVPEAMLTFLARDASFDMVTKGVTMWLNLW